nr:hypothetical protein [Clostridia bacterium]
MKEVVLSYYEIHALIVILGRFRKEVIESGYDIKVLGDLDTEGIDGLLYKFRS